MNMLTSPAFEIISREHALALYATGSFSPPHKRSALPVTAQAWAILHHYQLATASPTDIAGAWFIHLDGAPTADAATAYAWVSPSLPCFQGHFPGQPILPGVVQIQWALELAQQIWPTAARLENFRGTKRVKFKAPVLPDLIAKLTLQPQRQKSGLRISATLHSTQAELTTAELRYT